MPKGATGRVPAVVTITGSGRCKTRTSARRSSRPKVSAFRQVADTLGRRGIAVLRLDDRTIGLSQGKPGTSADYADGIQAAVAFLRTRAEIDGDRIALLGHSEGGTIAPMVAATDPRLKGIVLLAGTADNGRDIDEFQSRDAIEHDRNIPAAAHDSALRVAMNHLDSLARSDRLGFSIFQYDPLPTARRVKVPALILQGATDHQVTPEQAEKLAAAMRSGGNADVTVHLFPEVNHLFVHDTSGLTAGYVALRSGRVSPDVLGMLADWLVVKLAVKQ